MTRTLGLVGGVGYQSTMEYYFRVMAKYQERFGDMNYPEIAIFSLSHGRFKSCEDARDLDGYLAYIMYGIDRVIAAGAHFVALAANSPHAVIEDLRKMVKIPISSAVESALAEAQRLGFCRALLLGIKFTMQSTFYQECFARAGIELVAPSLPDQEIIHNVIYRELLKGVVLDSSRDRLVSLTRRYDVDGVVLGCMKLPTLLDAGDSRIQVINTLDLHTTDILDYIYGEDKASASAGHSSRNKE